MNKQLYLEAIEALRQRVEAAGEGEELSLVAMLARELSRLRAIQAEATEPPPAEVARFLATESVERPLENPPSLVIDAWGWRSAGLLDNDDLIALEDDDYFRGGDWDGDEDEDEDEDNSDLWEADEAHEYAPEDDGEDTESGI